MQVLTTTCVWRKINTHSFPVPTICNAERTTTHSTTYMLCICHHAIPSQRTTYGVVSFFILGEKMCVASLFFFQLHYECCKWRVFNKFMNKSFTIYPFWKTIRVSNKNATHRFLQRVDDEFEHTLSACWPMRVSGNVWETGNATVSHIDVYILSTILFIFDI